MLYRPYYRINGPLAVSSRCAGKILIAPTKYLNPNNRIRLVLATTFTADMKPGFAQGSHRAIVGSSFTADCLIEIFSAVKSYSQFHLFNGSSFTVECKQNISAVQFQS